MTKQSDYLGFAAGMVAAFVSHNTVRVTELPDLIASVHTALAKLGAPPVEEPAPELKPSVSIRKSVTPDYLISLEDGKHYKALKRHLKVRGMTPEAYRAKWSLPSDYPMTAPNYTMVRSELARAQGLGSRRGAEAEVVVQHSALKSLESKLATLVPVVDDVVAERPNLDAPATKRRGRPKKAT